MRNSHTGLALLICTLFTGIFACTAPDTGGPPGGDVDAAPVDPDGGGGGETCAPPATSVPSGNHNAGLACMSCHTGAVAPRWTIAGTLYASSSGTAPLSGATITITDANQVVTRLTTAVNGNFYSGAAFAFPVRVNASRCPDSKQMGEAAPNGNCNGCHQPGGVGRIHLP